MMVGEDAVKRFPMFSELAPEDVKELARHLEYETYREGEVLFREGDPGERIFFLLKGSVGLYRLDPFGKEMKVAVSGEGTPLGELSFLSRSPHSFKGVTLGETEALVLTRKGYTLLKSRNPELAVKLLESLSRILAERLKDMTRRFVDTASFIWGGPKK